MKVLFFVLSLFFSLGAVAQMQGVVPVPTSRIFVIDSFAKGPELQVITDGNAYPYGLRDYASFTQTFGDNLSVRMIYQAFSGLDLSFIRSQDLIQGLEVLRHGNFVNIIVLPSLRTLPEAIARNVRIKAVAVAKELNAMVLIDPPGNLTPAQVVAWRDSASELVGQSNVAIYYPDMIVTNPLNNQRYTVGPSSVMAAMYSQNDSYYDVWHAPGRFELPGAEGYTYQIPGSQVDYFRVAQNGVAINPIAYFPGQGNLVWGAVTADSLGEYRYIAYKRTSLMIESSIQEFHHVAQYYSAAEAQTLARTGISNFMKDLNQQGAIFGSGGDDTIKLYTSVSGNTMLVTLDFALTGPGQMTRLQFTQTIHQ